MPLGRVYFITFSAYGTRLPGRKEGSYHWDSQYIEPNEALYNSVANNLNEKPVNFSPTDRALLHDSFMATALQFGWQVDALNVREDHVHIVVFSPDGKRSDEIVRKLKTGATYVLYNSGKLVVGSRVWTKMYASSLGWDMGFWRGTVKYTLKEQGPNDYLYESQFGQNSIREIHENRGKKKYTLQDLYGGESRAASRAVFFRRLAKQSAAERIFYLGDDYAPNASFVL